MWTYPSAYYSSAILSAVPLLKLTMARRSKQRDQDKFRERNKPILPQLWPIGKSGFKKYYVANMGLNSKLSCGQLVTTIYLLTCRLKFKSKYYILCMYVDNNFQLYFFMSLSRWQNRPVITQLHSTALYTLLVKSRDHVFCRI